MEWICYSRAIKSGGATVKSTSAGGSSTQTSSSGGGSTQTSSSGGGVSKSTSAGGGTTETSSAGGNHRHMFVADNGAVPDSAGDGLTRNFLALTGPNDTSGAAGVFFPSGGGGNLYTYGASGSHSHSVSLSPHSHSFSTPDHTHSVSIPSHTHTVSIPAHTHQIDIPDHTHGIDFGIFSFNAPTSVIVKVDGTAVPGAGIRETSLNLLPYLSKEPDGSISRGWHEIAFSSNGLGRVVASAVTRCFIQSRGGGQY